MYLLGICHLVYACSGKEEVGMIGKTSVAITCLMVLAILVGCGVRGVRRAPIDSIPEDALVEVRIEQLEAMTEEYPDDALLYFELANIYYEEAMPSDARRNYEKVLSLDHEMNKARINLAMLLAETDEPDSAKALLEEALRIDGTDAKAYSNLGMIYYADKDVPTAVRYFTKAVELDPESPEAHFNMGLAFAESGLLLEAIREWRRVLEITEEGETAQRARLSLERVERELKR
jgi:tetratricopeptide (TPR) repeat protein